MFTDMYIYIYIYEGRLPGPFPPSHGMVPPLPPVVLWCGCPPPPPCGAVVWFPLQKKLIGLAIPNDPKWIQNVDVNQAIGQRRLFKAESNTCRAQSQPESYLPHCCLFSCQKREWLRQMRICVVELKSTRVSSNSTECRAFVYVWSFDPGGRGGGGSGEMYQGEPLRSDTCLEAGQGALIWGPYHMGGRKGGDLQPATSPHICFSP